MQEIDFGNQGQLPRDAYYSIKKTREVEFPVFSYCDLKTTKTFIDSGTVQTEIWAGDLNFDPKPLHEAKAREIAAILSLMRDLPVLRSMSGLFQDHNTWRKLTFKLVERYYALSGAPLGKTQAPSA